MAASKKFSKKKKGNDSGAVLAIVQPKRSGGYAKRAFESEEQLQESIMAYFQYCYFKENGKQRVQEIIPNKAGLCLYLNISRETYSQYRKRYPDAIKNADGFIENAWIQRLKTNAPTGAIFYLKNAFKEIYKDKHELKTTGTTEHIHSFNEAQLQRIAGRVFNGGIPSAA